MGQTELVIAGVRGRKNYRHSVRAYGLIIDLFGQLLITITTKLLIILFAEGWDY